MKARISILSAVIWGGALTLGVTGCGGAFLQGTLTNCPAGYEKYVDVVQVTLWQSDLATATTRDVAVVRAENTKAFNFQLSRKELKALFGEDIKRDEITKIRLAFEKYINPRIVVERREGGSSVSDQVSAETIGKLDCKVLRTMYPALIDSPGVSFYKVFEKLSVAEYERELRKSSARDIKLDIRHNSVNELISCEEELPPIPVEGKVPLKPGE